MTKYREIKAKKILAGIKCGVQMDIKACIQLLAESTARNDEPKSTEWVSRIAGITDCLCALEIINIKEMMLLNEYAISKAHEMAYKIQRGVA